jgi:myo-inositol-1(or 4)-monophosphatase
MVLEAGGLVGDLQGEEHCLERGMIIAGNPKIFAQLVQVMGPHLTPALRASSAAPGFRA